MTVQTSAEVRVNAHVARRARQTFVLAERYVLLRRRVNVFFRQTKVNNMYHVLLPVGVPANQKVLRFYVAINQMFRVDIFYP